MTSATLTSKGRITIPTEVRRGLGVDAGDRVEFVEMAPGQYLLMAATHDVRELKGIVPRPGQPVSVEEMNNAAVRRRAGR
jgi:antitoxin PrlF